MDVCAGTLTQNDMQVVRMWIGGSDYSDLNLLQPPQPGQSNTMVTCAVPICTFSCSSLPHFDLSWFPRVASVLTLPYLQCPFSFCPPASHLLPHPLNPSFSPVHSQLSSHYSLICLLCPFSAPAWGKKLSQQRLGCPNHILQLSSVTCFANPTPPAKLIGAVYRQPQITYASRLLDYNFLQACGNGSCDCS